MAGVKSSGVVDLAQGLKSRVSINTYFQGARTHSNNHLKLRGPSATSFAEESPAAGQEFAPCDSKRSLNVNTSALVRGRVNYGNVTVETTTLDLEWKVCE